MKKLLPWIKHPAVIAITIAIVLWFVLPLVKISGGYPFQSVGMRSLILTLMAVAFFAKQILAFIQQHKAKVFSVIWEKIKITYSACRYGLKQSVSFSKSSAVEIKERIKSDRRKRQLRKLPWYLVLGTPGAGKKTVIKDTGLSFARPEYFGEEAVQYINQFPDYEWWFSPQAVMIDPMTYHLENDKNNIFRFLKLLKKERHNKPLNGIVLSVSIVDLMRYTHQQRQEFIQSISVYIREIYHQFKAMVPVYLTFTKCDLIEGFLEFFSDLSKEELSQVWGMTLPIDQCADQQFVQQFFHKEYQRLLEKLRHRVLWAMDGERTARGRELIHAFPQQMQFLQQTIQNFILELFGAVRYPKALQMRGVYFVSCHQGQGESEDLVLKALSRKYQFVPPKFQKPDRLGESYFMQSLFLSVIYPESAYLGDSERSRRRRELFFKSIFIACPVVVLGSAVGMYSGYQDNKANLVQVKNDIALYHTNMTQVKSGDKSLLMTLPALGQLNRARSVYEMNHALGLKFLFATSMIRHDINSAMARSLHAYFLPRVASIIESQLNDNISDQNLLYATLKGYLAFSAANTASRYAVTVPMVHAWNQQFLRYPETKDKLRYYLALALANPVEKLPLDNGLISRIREQLEQVIPSERAYGLLQLRSSVTSYPNLIVSTAVGDGFSKIFTLKDDKVQVPPLFTALGFEKIFVPNYKKIAEEVAEDNRDIGLANLSSETQSAGQISDIIQKRYDQSYINTWDKALSNVQVKPFSSLNDAIERLDLIASKRSPMAKLLDLIHKNTADVSHDEVNVSAHFEKLNEFTEGGGDVSWNKITKDIQQVHDYFVKLSQASNQNLAMFNAAKAAMGGEKSPIQQLSFDANKAPLPARRWLQTLSQQCWEVVVSGAHAQMNDAWNSQIMPNYRQAVRGRYPLDPHADSEVSIKDFNAFFGSGGELDHYFNQYVKPFVNTDSESLHYYEVNGHSIELPKSRLTLFERVKRIQSQFFPHHAKTASLSFTLKPLTLSSDASSIDFTVGGQDMNYSHGPQNITQLSWPFDFNNQDSSIVMTGFDQNQYTHSASGPWSFFKVLDNGVLHTRGDNGTYLFTINFKGYHASFELTGADNIQIFKLTALKGLSLPSVIAPNGEEK